MFLIRSLLGNFGHSVSSFLSAGNVSRMFHWPQHVLVDEFGSGFYASSNLIEFVTHAQEAFAFFSEMLSNSIANSIVVGLVAFVVGCRE